MPVTTMKKRVVYIVALGFTKVTFVALVDKGRNTATKMKADPAYADLADDLTALEAACDKLDAANQQVLFNGGKIEREEQRAAFALVKELYRGIGGQVQAITQGDKEKILAAGFDVVRSGSPIGQLAAPGNVRVRVSAYPGRLDVRWNGVYGRNLYELYVAQGDPEVEANWKLLTMTSKNFHAAEGLTSNAVYYFRVVAVGTAGPSPVSDSASAKAA
jgi:hypothetical protein